MKQRGEERHADSIEKRKRLREVALLFSRLGCTAFGGPAAHISMMEQEVVTGRKWMSREHFLDLVGATNLIPGPNSTEMAIHCGFHRAGWWGLLVAGACFIAPAALISVLLAWLYAAFGTIPDAARFLVGMKPAVLAVILVMVMKLGRKALKRAHLAFVGALVIALAYLGVSEVLAIFAGGGAGIVAYTIKRSADRLKGGGAGALTAMGTGVSGAAALGAVPLSASVQGVTFLKVLLIFAKIGSVLFGSGYLLLAYLEGELVSARGWITREVLLDAIAVGQFTPGPILSASTFVGFQLMGIWGAAAATFGIFLPSFVFVALLNPFIPVLRNSPVLGAFLDAVNISAVGLMAFALYSIGSRLPLEWKTLAIGSAALGIQLKWQRVNTSWIVLGGAAFGYMLSLLGR